MKQYEDQCFKNLMQIVYQIEQENIRQVKKWGVQKKTMFEWVTNTTEELGSLAKAISEYEYRKGSKAKVISEAVQVATLALKIAEMYEREKEEDK